MKTILRTALIAGLILTTSCGKETANTIADIFDEEVEELESTALDIENVTDNVLIEGATKMEGAPPTPNGAISLDLSNTSKSALLNEGFDIAFSSDGDVTGAYIQFKSIEGNISDAYFDVKLESNNSNKNDKSLRRRRFKKPAASLKGLKTDEAIFDIDFNSTIEPGKFCYEICVYDVEGNISNPQEVCVTVESWGGSSKIEGKWNLFKEVDIFGGQSTTTLVGEQDCSGDEVFNCNNGGSFTADYWCYLTNSSSFTFKADGTFEYTNDDYSKEIRFNESKESCEALYDEVESTEITNGNWAYVEDTNELILIMSKDVYTVNGETETSTYQPGEGAIFAEIGIFLIDDVIRLGPGEESSENSYYRK
ncbi:hypothetical protein FEE95_04555 [Maribacter algarum]|uniref:Lipocalin-like domain-containing protein n=1 Tax=Maribacter algarum (ex Zhang et al. 2020) TaxID=2578118 RepID=A0A5S3PUL8_9FLAO|nr:hypothetical protein [Maribacter algarum]TMM58706.1 hypothetical protein FEE95_04555 [Maribacter algarum]